MKKLIAISALLFSTSALAGHHDGRGAWAQATTNSERNEASVRLGAPEGEWGRATAGNGDVVVNVRMSCPASEWGRVTTDRANCMIMDVQEEE